MRSSFGTCAGDRQDLVDLLLVLDGGETHLGMRQHIGQLVGDGVGIDRNRNGAERLRRHHRPIELRPVGADDRDGVAARDAEPVQPDRIGAHDFEHLGPGPGVPDAKVLVADSRPLRVNRARCGSAVSETCRAGGVDRHGASSQTHRATTPARPWPLADGRARSHDRMG